MQKDLQDGEMLDVGGYQVTLSTTKEEIIEILHKVGETTDFTRLTREELKALLEKERQRPTLPARAIRATWMFLIRNTVIKMCTTSRTALCLIT